MTVTKLYKRAAMALLLIATLVVQTGGTSAAGTAKLSLSPASGSHLKGSSFAVTIHENSGTTDINAVEADLTYDQTKLQFISVDTTVNSNFNGSNGTCPVANGGNGSVKVACAKYGSTLTGDQTVAKVTFKAIGTGTTSVRFANSSAIVKPEVGGGTTNVWDGNTNGGTYTLTSSTTSGGSKTTTTPKTPTTTQPTTTSGGSTSKTGSTAKNKATSKATPTQLTYLVAIKVEDSNKKPVKNAKVTIDNQPASLYDEAGIASFSGISAGIHTVVASAGGKQATKSITVIAGNPTAVQQYDLTLPIGGKKSILPWVIIGGALILILMFVGGRIAMGKSPKQDNHNYEPLSGTDPDVSVGPLAATVIPNEGKSGKVVTGGSSTEDSSQVIHPDPNAEKINAKSKP